MPCSMHQNELLIPACMHVFHAGPLRLDLSIIRPEEFAPIYVWGISTGLTDAKYWAGVTFQQGNTEHILWWESLTTCIYLLFISYSLANGTRFNPFTFQWLVRCLLCNHYWASPEDIRCYACRPKLPTSSCTRCSISTWCSIEPMCF